MTMLKDREAAGSQDWGTKRESEKGDTHEGTAVGRRGTTDGEMDQADRCAGSSGMS